MSGKVDKALLLFSVSAMIGAVILASRTGTVERAALSLTHTTETPPSGRKDVAEREGRPAFNLDSDYNTDDLSEYTPEMRADEARARTHMRRGEFKEAEAAYREVLAARPNSASTMSAAATARGLGGDLDGAEKEFYRALELDSADPSSLVGIGYVQARRGDYEGAYRSYRTLLDRFPHNGVGLRGLGSAAVRTGRYEEAITALTRFSELYPNSEYAPDSRALLEEARSAQRSRRVSE